MTPSSVSSVRSAPAVDSGCLIWVDFSEESGCDDAVISHADLPAILPSATREVGWQTELVLISVPVLRGLGTLALTPGRRNGAFQIAVWLRRIHAMNCPPNLCDSMRHGAQPQLRNACDS